MKNQMGMTSNVTDIVWIGLGKPSLLSSKVALRFFGHGDTQTSFSSNSSNSGSTGSFGSGISSASSDRNSHDYPLGESGTDNTGVSEFELNENGLIDISGDRALSGSSHGGDLTLTEILLLEEWEIQFSYPWD